MTQNDSSNKVININQKMMPIKAKKLIRHRKKANKTTRVISITSGKGGVGKTNIVANLGYALGHIGKKILILDADLGLANIDVLLGLTPKYNLSHVITGKKRLNEITIPGPGNIQILPASSGIQELTSLSRDQGILFLKELDALLDSFDILLIDTAAGISSNVMYFNTTAQEIMVVVSPEPTSITDAYALMKILSIKYSQRDFKLIVNQATSQEDADEVFRQLSLVADRFLDIKIEYIGYIPSDNNIRKSVRCQKIVCEIYPDSDASKCFKRIAQNIIESVPIKKKNTDTNLIWKYLIGTDFE